MKPYTLKNREGESISPMTSTGTVFDGSGVDLDTLLVRQKEDTDNTLKDYPKRTEMTQALAGKQNTLATTADLNISLDNVIGLTQEFKDSKVDKIEGKELSTNDYTDEDKTKLALLPTGDKFTIKGYYLNKRGTLTKAQTDSTGVSPILPLNKTLPLLLKNVRATGTAVGVCFYAADETFISFPEGIENLNGDFTVPVDAYPDNACFFRVCTERTTSSYSNGDTIEELDAAAVQAIQASKYTLFVDMWTRCYDCSYDAKKAKPFVCNKVELKYEEAIDVYDAPRLTYNNCVGFTALVRKVKTLILESTGTTFGSANFYAAFLTNSFVILRVATGQVYVSSLKQAFVGCQSLQEILGTINLSAISTTENVSQAFHGCALLEEVRLHGLKVPIDFASSPLLSLASMQYLVVNAANTSPITVTLHPDAYARLTDELIAQAAEKNITFATT